jgi:hypothetical protein
MIAAHHAGDCVERQNPAYDLLCQSAGEAKASPAFFYFLVPREARSRVRTVDGRYVPFVGSVRWPTIQATQAAQATDATRTVVAIWFAARTARATFTPRSTPSRRTTRSSSPPGRSTERFPGFYSIEVNGVRLLDWVNKAVNDVKVDSVDCDPESGLRFTALKISSGTSSSSRNRAGGSRRVERRRSVEQRVRQGRDQLVECGAPHFASEAGSEHSIREQVAFGVG